MKLNQQLNSPEKIYNLLTQCLSTKNSSHKENLNNQLNKLIDYYFVEQKHKELNDLLFYVHDRKEEVLEFLLDNIQFQIDNLFYEKGSAIDNSNQYVSHMFLLPIFLLNENSNNLKTLNIYQIEKNLREKVLKYGLLKEPSNLVLGTTYLTQNTIEQNSFHDWWNIHRQTWEENFVKGCNKQKTLLEHDRHKALNLFYLPVLISFKLEDLNLINEFAELDDEHPMFHEISSEFNSEENEFLFYSFKKIEDSVSTNGFFYQEQELHLFLDDYKKYDNIDLGYIFLENQEAMVIFLIDNDENVLIDHYVFYLNENYDDVFEVILDNVKEFNSKNLWYFEQVLGQASLKAWNEIKDENSFDKSIDLSKLLEIGHKISLQETEMALYGYNPNQIH